MDARKWKVPAGAAEAGRPARGPRSPGTAWEDKARPPAGLAASAEEPPGGGDTADRKRRQASGSRLARPAQVEKQVLGIHLIQETNRTGSGHTWGTPHCPDPQPGCKSGLPRLGRPLPWL